RSFDDLFRRIPPDVIFAANLTSMEDARLLRAAMRRSVLTIGMPKGWDNLTLKTFLPIFPDRLLVQTSAMKEDAMFLGYPGIRIAVVGFPKFDLYADEAHESRDMFLQRFGFDPAKKCILYAGAGDQLAPHDEEILRDLLEAIEKGEIHSAPTVIVRPHPKYTYRSEMVPKRDFWALDVPGTKRNQGSDFEFTIDDVMHLRSSLQHTDLLIHTASTLGVEAAIFDTPMITLAYDGDTQVPRDLSTGRYYRYTHMQRVIETGGMKVVHSRAELITAVNQYLENPGLDHKGRVRLVDENAHTIDGMAGMRVAHEILDTLGAAREVEGTSL
ncbi:MAG: CDP-glycerol glycerophosphotransferase family protein, partial [Minisyncoccia bacterium]